jgi:hypothetical protein
VIPLISAPQVVRITGMSHWHLAQSEYFKQSKSALQVDSNARRKFIGFLFKENGHTYGCSFAKCAAIFSQWPF